MEAKTSRELSSPVVAGLTTLALQPIFLQVPISKIKTALYITVTHVRHGNIIAIHHVSVMFPLTQNSRSQSYGTQKTSNKEKGKKRTEVRKETQKMGDLLPFGTARVLRCLAQF